MTFLEINDREQEAYQVLFSGLNKGYRAKFKKGLLLLKIDHSIELSATRAQKRIIREQIDALGDAMIRTNNDPHQQRQRLFRPEGAGLQSLSFTGEIPAGLCAGFPRAPWEPILERSRVP